MADENTGGEGAEKTGTDEFDPKTLSPEAQEHMRREIQRQSDSKAAAQTAAEVRKLRTEQARSARSAVESAEEKEDILLAESGQLEALGQRVKARLEQRGVRERAILDASTVIEEQMREAFVPSLGEAKVQAIHQEVVEKGGAHAEFAMALAAAHDSQVRQEEIQAEVKAQLAEARGEKRDATSGADKVSGSGQGQPPSTDAEIEQGYIEGRVSRKAYEAMLEAREKRT